MATWLIEKIEQTSGSDIYDVAWRCNDGLATAYGKLPVEGLTITPSTTEAEVVEKVKHALNATKEQRDEKGNLIPPAPGTQTCTQEIETALVKHAAELAHPKVQSVSLPWSRPAPAPPPAPASQKKK